MRQAPGAPTAAPGLRTQGRACRVREAARGSRSGPDEERRKPSPWRGQGPRGNSLGLRGAASK